MAAATQIETAWATGLFDGEGSIVIAGGWLKLQLKMCDVETVERFAAIVSSGRVYGPYPNRTGEKDGYGRRDFYLWVCSPGDAFSILRSFWPYLSDVRKRRALELGFVEVKRVAA